MFGLKSKAQKQAEQDLAQWLAHPNEYGVAPKKVRHKRSYKLNLMGYGAVEIHLLEYEMPDGSKGRGFVHPVTWAFLSKGIEAIPDEALLICYCGWAWLVPSVQRGTVKTNFVSAGEEGLFLAGKASRGFENVQITGRYQIGESELFEYSARYRGVNIRGAGNTDGEIGFPESDPLFRLPPIYTLIGKQVIQR